MNKLNHDSFGRAMIIVGMQYGSEGKGAITEYLSPAISLGIRSGAANAGHTIYYKNQKFIMRQIPSVWINPITKLAIGIGAVINLDILLKEIEHISKFSKIKDRLFIDSNAHVITKEEMLEEQNTDLASRIGSTSAISGEGIGTATANKVLRKSSRIQAKDVPQLKPYLSDTVDLINTYLDMDELVLIEGTQGFGLSLEHGQFPFVTSRDVSATGIAASVGISTHRFFIDVIGVARTYPIRVAGNSGPFDEDSQEITWKELAKKANADKSITEKTSVTNKIRRVATFSKKHFVKACQVNRPTEIAITFADYLDWATHEKQEISEPIDNFIKMIEEISGGIPVKLIKTGPKTTIDLDWYRRSILRRIK